MQNAQCAETKALLRLVAVAERPAHEYIDNEAVVGGFQRILAWGVVPEGPREDV